MAPTWGCDLTALFNNPKQSDVTIKFGEREIACHSLILRQSSKYFDTMLDPDKPFSEGAQAIVELKEDDPDAVEVMLRYAYNFEYLNAIGSMALKAGAQLHMRIFTAARKYLYPQLEAHALAGVKAHMSLVESNFTQNFFVVKIKLIQSGRAEMIELVTFLSTYREHYPTLSNTLKELVKKYHPKLFPIPQYRALLELKENKDVLDFAVKAVESAWEAERKPKHTMTICCRCGLAWENSKIDVKCPGCGFGDGDRGWSHLTSRQWREG